MTTWRVTHLVWRDSWMSHDAHKCVCMRVCISFGGCIYHWNIIESVSSDIDILLFSAWKQKRLYNHLQVWAYNSIAKLRCVRVCHGALFFFSFFFHFRSCIHLYRMRVRMRTGECCACALYAVHELKCMRLHCIYLIRFRNVDIAWVLYTATLNL